MFLLRNSVLFLCWTLLSVHGLVLGRLLSPPPALLKISSTRLCILAYEGSICRFPGDSSVKSFLLLLSLVFIVSPHALVLQVSKGLWANSPTAQRYFSVVPVGLRKQSFTPLIQGESKVVFGTLLPALWSGNTFDLLSWVTCLFLFSQN